MSEWFVIGICLVQVGAVLAAFYMGYMAGKKEERLTPPPRMDNPFPVEPENERAPTDEEIREDMVRARTAMQGYDFDKN